MRILMVQSCARANETVRRHFPYYENAGCDRIVGVLTHGGKSTWPTDDVAVIGKDSYVDGPHLCNRLIETLDIALTMEATEIVVIEYDVCFFKPLPKFMPDGLVMNRTGGWNEGFRGTSFFHPPWIMNWTTAGHVIDVGYRMISEGDFEKGWPDRFIGRIADVTGIPVVGNWFTSYTQNSIDRPEYMDNARQARINGCHAIHGVKTKECLEYIIKP